MKLSTSFVYQALCMLSAVVVGEHAPAVQPVLQIAHAAPPSAVSAFTYERIDKNDAVLLVVDHQEGLYQIARDFPAVEMRSNIMAHAALGKIFNLPTILTSSAETGECTCCAVLDGSLTGS